LTILTSIMVGVIFAASIYLMLSRELKSVCMGMFLLGHGANLAIIAVSRSPLGKLPPILQNSVGLDRLVDPTPQALILTAIVIGFAVQAFLLTLLVVTWRRNKTLEVGELAAEHTHNETNAPDAYEI
jgi:multicomponent Na+:H+ antiporter subunit C